MEKDLPYHELTRKVIGAIFDVFKELGFGLQEKYYQRALGLKLDELGQPFVREKMHRISFNGQIIGRYFVDFIVDNIVVVEIKIANEFYETHIKQVVGYLKASKLAVGIIAIITPSGVKIKRIIHTSQ